MNILQLYRCRELFELEIKKEAEKGRFIEMPEQHVCWINFKIGFEAALIDKPPILSQQQIIDLARRVTVDFGHAAANPYHRNSANYRYWQDGCRVGTDELEEREENVG